MLLENWDALQPTLATQLMRHRIANIPHGLKTLPLM